MIELGSGQRIAAIFPSAGEDKPARRAIVRLIEYFDGPYGRLVRFRCQWSPGCPVCSQDKQATHVMPTAFLERMILKALEPTARRPAASKRHESGNESRKIVSAHGASSL